MVNAVITLSESNILSAPVFSPGFRDSMNWKKRYLGILDYSAVILWVLENTEIMATSSAVHTSAMGAPPAADKIGNDFYKSILQEEPFQSTTVSIGRCNHLQILAFLWIKYCRIHMDLLFCR